MKRILCVIESMGKFPHAGYRDTLSFLVRLNKEYNKNNEVVVLFITGSEEIKRRLKRHNLKVETVKLKDISKKGCFDDISFLETKWPQIRRDYFCDLYFPESNLLLSSVIFYDRLWPVMKSAWESYELVKGFIKKQRYNLLLCIGDGIISRHLLCDAKKKRISSIGVTFSLLREKRLIDSIFLYDYIFVRQKEDRDFLVKVKGVSQKRIEFIGDHYFEKYLPYLKRKLIKEKERLYKKLEMNSKSKLIVIPFYGDYQWDIKRILEVLQTLVIKDKEIKVVIKCHPYSKIEVLFCQKYYEPIIKENREFHIIGNEWTIQELLSVAKIVVTPKYSLMVEESLAFSIPVVIMDYYDINCTSKMECRGREGIFVVNEFSELPVRLKKLFSFPYDFKTRWQNRSDKEERFISKIKEFLAG